jgi:hypothetical protein
MSTNKRGHLRRWGTLKNQYRSTKNKDGRDKCYVYINHITKIGKISQRDKSVPHLIINDPYFFL